MDTLQPSNPSYDDMNSQHLHDQRHHPDRAAHLPAGRGAHPGRAGFHRASCTGRRRPAGRSCCRPAGRGASADRRAARTRGSCRETEHIRNDPSWRVAPPAPGLEDRRVEITGPVDKKMTINALNSGAKVWLADMEDSSTPHLAQRHHRASSTSPTRWSAASTSPPRRARSTSCARPANCPPSWSAPAAGTCRRSTCSSTANPIAGGIVDFGLYFFHNARRLLAQGKGPYFYLPKIENHLEARLWNDIFILAQDLLGIPQGTIRATVLIETITAAFEMEEILYELRDHAAGLNAGRWDYIFSIIKNFRTRGPRFVLPDRSQVTMTAARSCAPTPSSWSGPATSAAPWPSAAWPQLVPNRKDEEANANAFEKVRADKTREAERRLRRLLGGPPRPGARLPRGVRRRPRRPAQPAGPAPRGRHPGRPRPHRRRRHRRAPSPSRASATTSRWASATSSPGCAATAPWPSTT